MMSAENLTRRKCIVVSVEAPWPVLNGGRARTSEVIKQLSVDYDVTVVYPGQAAEPSITLPPGVSLIAVNRTPKSKLSDRIGLLPRLGKTTLRAIRPELKAASEKLEPSFIYWSHSYLAAVGMAEHQQLPHLVEFANLEGPRSLSLSHSSRRFRNRISAFVEYLKSLWWEPRCARQAQLSISLNHHEASILNLYRANVVLVPNGFKQREYVPSPVQSRRVLTLGSWTYGPNRTALEAFLTGEWIDIVTRKPRMELVVAGPGSDDLLDGRISDLRGVTSLGYVDDLDQVFRDCFCFLAPAASGGGSQLKIAEALSRHRTVIGPSFLKREVSPGMPLDVLIATDDMVGSVIGLFETPERRHAIEGDISRYVADRTWEDSFLPVRKWLADVLQSVPSLEEQPKK